MCNVILGFIFVIEQAATAVAHPVRDDPVNPEMGGTCNWFAAVSLGLAAGICIGATLCRLRMACGAEEARATPATATATAQVFFQPQADPQPRSQERLPSTEVSQLAPATSQMRMARSGPASSPGTDLPGLRRRPVPDAAATRTVRDVNTQSQTVYTHWRATPRFILSTVDSVTVGSTIRY